MFPSMSLLRQIQLLATSNEFTDAVVVKSKLISTELELDTKQTNTFIIVPNKKYTFNVFIFNFI